MKNIFLLFISFSLLCCQSIDANNQTVNQSKEHTDCKKSIILGGKEICLPEIDGMKECYEVPIVKSLADKNEYSANSVLAFYLNNSTFEKVDQLGDFSFDDYFKIYAMTKLKTVDVSKAQFTQFANEMTSNFIRKNWDELKRKIDNQDFEFSVGQPVLIDDYSPHDQANTYVMLLKLSDDENEKILACTMNMILLKERLIFLAYYKNYENPESIKTAKSKNDFIVHRLISENK